MGEKANESLTCTAKGSLADPIGVSNAKNFATKFFGSEMTPAPLLERFQKFTDNGTDRRP